MMLGLNRTQLKNGLMLALIIFLFAQVWQEFNIELTGDPESSENFFREENNERIKRDKPASKKLNLVSFVLVFPGNFSYFFNSRKPALRR